MKPITFQTLIQHFAEILPPDPLYCMIGLLIWQGFCKRLHSQLSELKAHLLSIPSQAYSNLLKAHLDGLKKRDKKSVTVGKRQKK